MNLCRNNLQLFSGARLPTYSNAAANTRVVGACIGFFIETLCKTFNQKNDMFYLIGHGLGGHAAGYAGKRLHDPKIQRITALDPAGSDHNSDHFVNQLVTIVCCRHWISFLKPRDAIGFGRRYNSGRHSHRRSGLLYGRLRNERHYRPLRLLSQRR